ncbi:MAG: T9SS type A sorting domain-containing protein, partial [Bacteroidota bacterium]
RFNKFLAIANGDVKQFTPNLISVGNAGQARQDVQDIKVFPNPYYGLNRAETDRVSRFVTFSHLPDQAIIRIFNLAGNLVRTLRKDDPVNTNQFLRWNLQNENGLPVASGIYIAYIEMGNIGTTKTLKIAIIQEQQFLRNY